MGAIVSPAGTITGMPPKIRSSLRYLPAWLAGFALLVLLLGRALPRAAPPIQTPTPTASPTHTLPPSPSTTATATPSRTPSPTPVPPTETASMTATPSEPQGCLEPPDEYSLVTVYGYTLNARTYAMLQHAAELYNGPLDTTETAITQGSYSPGVSASFGTHDGGGTVDLSVMYPGTWDVAYDEIDPLLHALRVAGFAAWLRDFNELYDGSPIHIHAVAVGDAHLTEAAQRQVYSSEEGYFSGMSGLPEGYGGPSPDRFGGPVICNWMVDQGLVSR